MSSGLQLIPARSGVATPLRQGQSIKIINTYGKQVIDTFAFPSGSPDDFMSMSHTRASCGRLIPAIGQSFVSNQRKPMLCFTEDTSPGIHDSLVAACDIHRYHELGAQGYHENCSDNLVQALKRFGIDWSSTHTPEPLNLFMNIPVNNDGTISFGTPMSQPGDYVKLTAKVDLIVAMSACPMDLNQVNGGNPTEAHFIIED